MRAPLIFIFLFVRWPKGSASTGDPPSALKHDACEIVIKTQSVATLSPIHTTISKQRSSLSKQRSTLLPQTATMSNDSIAKFRPFDKVECCFDIVAGVDGALARESSSDRTLSPYVTNRRLIR